MERAKTKRRVLRSQATRLINEANETCLPGSNTSTRDLDIYNDRLKEVQMKLTEVDNELTDMWTDDELEQEFASAYEYNDRLVSCIAMLKGQKYLQQAAPIPQLVLQTESSGTSSTPQGQHSVRVRLPKMELTQFDGRRKNWQAFWTQFERLVHHNSDLQTADKLNYLTSVLTGEAQRAIAGLQLTGDCYQGAIEILKERFGNKEDLMQDHLNSLLDIPSVKTTGDAKGLRRLYDNLQIHIRGLQALHVSSEAYAAILVPNLLRSLPADLVLNYHRTVATSSMQATIARTISGQENLNGNNNASSVSEHVKSLDTLMAFIKVEIVCYEKMMGVRQKSAESETRCSQHIESRATTTTAIVRTLNARFASRKNILCSTAMQM